MALVIFLGLCSLGVNSLDSRVVTVNFDTLRLDRPSPEKNLIGQDLDGLSSRDKNNHRYSF